MRVDPSRHTARVMLAYVSDVPCCRFGHNASPPSILHIYIYVYTYIYIYIIHGSLVGPADLQQHLIFAVRLLSLDSSCPDSFRILHDRMQIA